MNEPMLPGEARFWDLAEPLLGRPSVTRSTMMGLPCLRWNGAFFASCDRRTGDLLVKLAEARVDELVAAERANRSRRPAAGSASGQPSPSPVEELEAPPRRSARVLDHSSGPGEEEAVTVAGVHHAAHGQVGPSR